MHRNPSVLILSEVRSGGTVLFDTLGSHSQMRIAGELFDSTERNSWKPKLEEIARSTGVAVPVGPSSDVTPLFGRLFELYNGFSLHREGQLAHANPAWGHLAALRHLHVIHLHRHNSLEQYVSQQLAFQSGVWSRPPRLGWRRPKWATFKIDVDKCIQTMRRWRRDFEWSLALFHSQPHIVVSYEEIQDDLKSVLAACQEFLGIPAEPLRVRFKKLPQKRLRNLIVNFDELKDALSETEFAEYCIAGDAPWQPRRIFQFIRESSVARTLKIFGKTPRRLDHADQSR